MSKLSLSILNKSGEVQNVAILQKLPDSDTAYPLVWFAKKINDTNQDVFSWDVNWGLNWGTTDAPLADGVQFKSGGTLVPTDPYSANGLNAITISYQNDEFITQDPRHASTTPGGLIVTTDSAFTVSQAKLMAISVYLDGKPAIAMHGKPNGKFTFDTHPTYYLCVTDYKQGVAVDGSFLSNATQVQFSGGETALAYVLDEELTFVKTQVKQAARV